MDVRTSTGEKFVLARAVNRGGEAQIWTVQQDPHLVAKIYHKPTAEHQAKLTAMLAAPLTRVGSHPTVAWPLHLLYQQKSFVGYLMPRAAGSLPIFHYYNPARRQRLGLPHAWPRFLYRTATNLAAAIELVHAHGHIIGDLNESNVLVTQAAMVTLVDTDSFQIRPNPLPTALAANWLSAMQPSQTYRCGVGKAEYTPPELQGVDFKSVDRTTDHDNFALGVLIFYLLMGGYHPFAGVLTAATSGAAAGTAVGAASVGRVDLYGIKHGLFPYIRHGANAQSAIQPPPNAPAFAHLHPSVQDAFRRTFTIGHNQPERRVTAKEWKKLLHEAEAALIACPQETSHLYSRHLRHCPICQPAPAHRSSPKAPPVATTAVPSASTVALAPKHLPARWLAVSGLAMTWGGQRLSQLRLLAPDVYTLLHTVPHSVPRYVQQIDWHSQWQTVQSRLVEMPDRFVAAQRVMTAHAPLLGSWVAGNLIGTPLAALATVGGYTLLPQLAQVGPRSTQGQIMLLALLFATLLGACQAYMLRQSLLPWSYLRYAWVGVAALAGAVVGAASFQLLGPAWDQVSAWSAQSLQVTVLAALFGITLGFLQSLLLRQHLRLADDGRIWTIANGISGILTAQGWLWGHAFPFTWQWTTLADWQLNAGLGAVTGAGLGALLSGGVLLWMVQGPRRSFYLRHFAWGLLRWPLTPTRLRTGTVRWVRAILLLILVWFLLQVVAQLNGAAAAVTPPLPTDIAPHIAPHAGPE